MKNKLIALFIGILLPIVSVSNSNANENSDAVGGYAVVDPKTGVVHGVIVASSADPFGNGGVMPNEYLGCPAGCLIVQQSTADKNGNVAGIQGPNVTYNDNRNVFKVTEPNTIQNQTIIEFASNTSAIETEVSVSLSASNYEFGVQVFTNTDGTFQMPEVAPDQNISAKIAATTKEYACNNTETICSSRTSNGSNILVDELVSFNERSTAVQVETKIITEVKNKIKEQLALILSMLGKWLIP